MKFAIIGCGHIAHKHAEAIATADGAVLHAVYDTNCINAERFSQKYGCRVYGDLDELLQDPQIDIVNICTPTGLHAPLTIKAAHAGKNVIVEKPIALTLADADAMIEACSTSGVKLAVVHPNRFRPAVMALKQAIDEGKFGKLSHINATVRWNRDQSYYDQAAWRGTKAMDGGVLMNQAIHNLDLMLWLGGPVREVQAYTATRFRQIEAEDIAVAVVRFESGALGVVEAAATVYPRNLEETISVFGETGTAAIGGPTANWIRHWTFESMPQEQAEQLIGSIEADPFGMPGHHHIVSDMIDAVRNERKPVVSGEDGKHALALALSVYEAAEKRELPGTVSAG